MSFLFDCKCFIGTVFSVLKSDGVVEGGTGTMAENRRGEEDTFLNILCFPMIELEVCA